jgi:hypothetical protein
MTARTEQLVEEIDNLCEHPFLVRLMELSIIGLHFSEKSEVEPFPDVFYLLSVEARMTLFQRRMRSIQRLARELSRELDISSIPLSLHSLVEVFADAAYMRVSSVSDLLLRFTREVYEVSLTDKDTTFGNLRRTLVDDGLLRSLGTLCDPQRPFREFRNCRIHSGFESSFDDYDAAFEMASLFRDREMGLQVMSITDDSVVSLQYLYEKRRVELLSGLLEEVSELIQAINEILSILYFEFDQRFSAKKLLADSYVSRQFRT